MQRKRERAYEDGSKRKLRDELRNTEATWSRARNVVSESERRENELDGEVENVDELLPITVRKNSVLIAHELTHALHEMVSPFRHAY